MEANLKLKVGLDSLRKARIYVKESNYGRAFAHYLVFFELVDKQKKKHEKLFAQTLCIWGKLLEERSQIEDLCKCYLQALNYFPLNVEILNNFGAHLIRIEEYEEAKKYLDLAYNLSANFLPAEKNLMTVKGQLIERWHFPMLNDNERNMAYYKAILSYTAESNAKVIDIGTGCGLLSLFASNNENVASIHAVEDLKIISSVAKNVFQTNNMTKVKLLNKHSSDLNSFDIDGYANLLITEIFDVGLFGENALATLIYAWENLLEKNAKIIPSSATLYATGIECSDILKRNKLISKFDGLKLKNICLTADIDDPYESVNLKVTNYKQLTESKEILNIDFSNLAQLKELDSNERYFNMKSLRVINSGCLNAFAIWFDLHLDSNNTITTNPTKENVKCWEQAVRFVNHPYNCMADDKIEIKMQCHDGKLEVDLANENVTCSGCFKAPAEIITFLNDDVLTSTLLKLYDDTVRGKSILDVFPFPLLGLKYARNGNKLVCIAKSETERLLIEHVCFINEIPQENLTIIDEGTLNSILTNKSYKFDLILLNPVYKNGTVDANFLFNYNLCEMNLNLGGLLYPKWLNLICQVIQSDYLYSFNMVNDENLFGFHIARHINEYSVNEHFDIDKNFQHKKLSEPQCMGNVLISDNNQVVIRRQHCPLQQGKVVDGILYWFEFSFDEEIVVDTSSCSYYNYACFLIDRQQIKKENNELTLCLKQHRGLIKIYSETYLVFLLSYRRSKVIHKSCLIYP